MSPKWMKRSAPLSMIVRHIGCGRVSRKQEPSIMRVKGKSRFRVIVFNSFGLKVVHPEKINGTETVESRARLVIFLFSIVFGLILESELAHPIKLRCQQYLQV